MVNKYIKNKHRADLLCYCTSRYDKFWWDLDPRPRNLRNLADACIERGLEYTALTAWEDDRYERINRTAINLPKNYGFYDLKESGGSVAMVVNRNIYSKKAVIIRGQKIPTSEGAISVIGAYNRILTSDIPQKRSLEETLKIVKDMNGIIIAPSPYLPVWLDHLHEETLLKHLKDFDAIEAFNAEARSPLLFYNLGSLDDSNRKAEEFAKNHNIAGIAVSDAHLTKDIGRAYIYFDKELDLSNARNFVNSLRELIKSQEFGLHKELVPRINLWWIRVRLKYHGFMGI